MIIGPRALSRLGILGINRRNISYMMRANRRRLYPLVDDKIETKRLCREVGVPTGRLLAEARAYGEINAMLEQLDEMSQFVLKPAHGAMGNGIIVVVGRDGRDFIASGERTLTKEDLRYHAQSIIAGMFALGGRPDTAFAEELLLVHPEFKKISSGGVPDVRIVVYRSVPVMAMVRLPTSRSRGRANLHQGAVGAGISFDDGYTNHAMIGGRPIERHPDTHESLHRCEIPLFQECLQTGLRAVEATGLGYVGADVVVDARYGPVVLELNARPGLAIQMANRAGLIPRLDAVEELWSPGMSTADRIALGREVATRS